MSLAKNRPAFEITALGGPAGAEITGLDLARPLDPASRAAILEAFLAHHVLVFRAQDLTREEQAAFTRNFGELEEHVIRLADGKPAPLVQVISNLDENGQPTTRPYSQGNYHWHTDKSYHAIPSLATLLHAREVPAEGGDTLFANTARGYDPRTRNQSSHGFLALDRIGRSRGCRRSKVPPPSRTPPR